MILLAGLGAWFAASTLFAMGIGTTLPHLRWARRFRAVVAWDVFGANRRGTGRAATYTFQVRDSKGTTRADWQTVAEGHAGWAWHAWLWQPQRRVADGLRCFAKSIGGAAAEPASAAAASRGRLAQEAVGDYLARTCPLAPGHAREIRLVIRYSHSLSVGAGSASPVRPSAGTAALAAPRGGERAEVERVVVFSSHADDVS